jgi:hypothetical protein
MKEMRNTSLRSIVAMLHTTYIRSLGVNVASLSSVTNERSGARDETKYNVPAGGGLSKDSCPTAVLHLETKASTCSHPPRCNTGRNRVEMRKIRLQSAQRRKFDRHCWVLRAAKDETSVDIICIKVFLYFR